MMRFLLYEMRKSIIRKYMFFLLFASIILNMFIIYIQYRQAGIGLSEEITEASSSEKQWKYYVGLHSLLDGKITLEKVSYVRNELENYIPFISSGEYGTEYDPENTKTGYFYGDYSILETYFYSPLEYLVNYQASNDKIVEQAIENIDLFTEKGNQYETEKNQYIVKHYKGRFCSRFYDFQGWNNLIKYDNSDIFVFIFLLLAVVPCYHNENKYKMNEIILVSKNWIKGYLEYKRYALYFWSVFIIIIFSLSDCIMFYLLYGLQGGTVKLYALKEYQYTGFTGSILEFYVFMKILKCMGTLILTEISIFFCRVIKNVYITYIVLVSALAAGIYYSGFTCSTNPLIQYTTLLDPLSVLQFAEMSKKVYGLNFFGHYIPWLFGFVCIQLVVWLIFKFIFNSRLMIMKRRNKSYDSNGIP